MSKVTIGYQDGCLAPLFVSTMSIEKAREMDIDTIWVPDHFMGFTPKWMWKPEICAAAHIIHSGDALYDLAQDFRAKGKEEAYKETLRFIIERYPSSRRAVTAKSELEAMSEP